MTTELWLRYAHFVCVFLLFGCLLAEHLLYATQLNRQQLRKLMIVDAIYGVSATLAFAAGVALVFFGAKGTGFYMQNGLFHIKVGVFLLIALLSTYPTYVYISQFFSKKERAHYTLPPLVKWMVRIELILVLLMPLLAVMMARGVSL